MMAKQNRTILINDQVAFGKLRKWKAFVTQILDLLDVKSGYFEFTFVDNPTILDINKTYLNHHYETDIISFNLGDTVEVEGDIYISVDQAAENAKDRSISCEEEIHRLFVHGILHLLGYDDETPEDQKVMFEKQESLLKETGILA